MPFKSGNSGNPQGRPRGTKNKHSKIKVAVNEYLKQNAHRLFADIDSMNPQYRIKYMLELLPYVMPKQRYIEADLYDVDNDMLAEVYRELKSGKYIIEENG